MPRYPPFLHQGINFHVANFCGNLFSRDLKFRDFFEIAKISTNSTLFHCTYNYIFFCVWGQKLNNRILIADDGVVSSVPTANIREASQVQLHVLASTSKQQLISTETSSFVAHLNPDKKEPVLLATTTGTENSREKNCPNARLEF